MSGCPLCFSLWDEVEFERYFENDFWFVVVRWDELESNRWVIPSFWCWSLLKNTSILKSPEFCGQKGKNRLKIPNFTYFLSIHHFDSNMRWDELKYNYRLISRFYRRTFFKNTSILKSRKFYQQNGQNWKSIQISLISYWLLASVAEWISFYAQMQTLGFETPCVHWFFRVYFRFPSA
jgi:hypothetical protein